jgi:circadian clock protein KaiB
MPNFPPSYKGIALFTPGGDLVYGIDPGKQGRWHAQLAKQLQTALNLLEPPDFLVPCFTATVDCWCDPHTQEQRVLAEIAPNVWRYRALLNAIFGVETKSWQVAKMPAGVCDPVLMKHYRSQFPRLWEMHNLVLSLDTPVSPAPGLVVSSTPPGYVFCLFVAGYSQATERTLKGLHRILEESLPQPYTLTVIDIVRQPEEAEAHHITATPTLVKIYPEPVKRLVGNLDTVDRLLRMLGLK